MNTPKAQDTASLPTQRTSEDHAAQPSAANKGARGAINADAGVQTPSSPVKRETANARAVNARVPKGPFKVLTIPQA